MIETFGQMWPWSLPPGNAFLMWFVLLAPLVAFGSVFAAYFIAQWRDGPVLRLSSASAPSSSTATRATGTSTSPFVIGRLPAPADQPLLGWLRAGEEGLRAVLLTRAAAKGFVKESAGSYTVVVDAPDLDPIERTFLRRLTGVARLEARHIEAAAKEAAAAAAPRMRALAARAGLVRGGAEQLALLGIACSGAAVVVGATLLRIAVRASLYLDAPLPTNLLGATVVVVGVAVFMSLKLLRHHRQVRAYLRWLDEATVAVRQTVAAGAGQGDDLALAAALGGLVALGASGRALAVPGMPALSTSSGSSSSSSCGGSSCGGSSCGGGGCGGGGCS